MKNVFIIISLMWCAQFLKAQCDNQPLYPSNPIVVVHGENVITSLQNSGEYNLTTGYFNGYLLEFSSSNPTDFITLRKTNHSNVIAYGTGSVTINYNQALHGPFIEMHINYDNTCMADNFHRVTSVTVTPYCNNPYLDPANAITVDCGQEILISNEQFAGQYNLTNGFLNGKNVTFYTSEPTDFITLRRNDNGNAISTGTGSVMINYNQALHGTTIEMHINNDDMCDTAPSTRSTYVYSDCCTALIQNPQNAISTNCGSNTIMANQKPGEYNITTNFLSGNILNYVSSENTDFIILRKDNANQDIIKTGTGSVSIVYNPNMGDNIQMHVFKDDVCTISNQTRTITLIKDCDCNNIIEGLFPYETTLINCNINEITNEQVAGEFNKTTGYIDGTTLLFSSSNPNDKITIRKNTAINTFISTGIGYVSLLYNKAIHGDTLQMHINTAVNCGTEFIGRTTSVYMNCPNCQNNILNPLNSPNVTCDSTTTITSAQKPGEYCFLTNLLDGSHFTVSSSVLTDYLTILKPSTGGTTGSQLLAGGVGSVSLLYENATHGDTLQMHISANVMCETNNVNRTTTISQTGDQCLYQKSVEVLNGNVVIEKLGSGMILKSPNGSCFIIKVDNEGNLMAVPIECKLE